MTDRERLIAGLVRLRELAGLSRVQVAKLMDCSGETIRRMERDLGVHPPRPSAVRYLLEIYEAPDRERAYLSNLASTLHQRRSKRRP